MSASEAPTPEEMAQEFPITPEQARQLAEALTPLQNFTDIGSATGYTLEELPGPGNKLVGVVLRNVATHVNLASQQAELVARVIDFYVTAQTEGMQDLFPPPEVLAAELEANVDTARQAAEGFGFEQ